MRSTHAIIIFKGKVLLILRDKNIKRDPNRWCLPGGLIEEEEKVSDAIRRELREEIGIVPIALTYIGTHTDTLGIPHELFYTMLTTTEASNIILGNEGQEVRFFAFDQLENISLTNTLELFFKKNKEVIETILKEASFDITDFDLSV